MNKSGYVVCTLLTLQLLSCKSQVSINNAESTIYAINGLERHVLSYSIDNLSDNKIWFWFGQDTCSKRTDEEKIKFFFFKVNDQFKTNLYQIATDGNIEVFIPEIYQTFIAKIPSNQSFRIEIMVDHILSSQEIEQINKKLYSRVQVFKEDYILQNFPRLNYLNEIIFFERDRIIFNYQDFLNR